MYVLFSERHNLDLKIERVGYVSWIHPRYRTIGRYDGRVRGRRSVVAKRED
jgi:hypothetical protein